MIFQEDYREISFGFTDSNGRHYERQVKELDEILNESFVQIENNSSSH